MKLSLTIFQIPENKFKHHQPIPTVALGWSLVNLELSSIMELAVLSIQKLFSPVLTTFTVDLTRKNQSILNSFLAQMENKGGLFK